MEGIKCSWCEKLTHRQKMLITLVISVLVLSGVFCAGVSIGKKTNGFGRHGNFERGMMGRMMERGGCPMMNNMEGRQYNNNNFGEDRNNGQMMPQGQGNFKGENNITSDNQQPVQAGQQKGGVVTPSQPTSGNQPAAQTAPVQQ